MSSHAGSQEGQLWFVAAAINLFGVVSQYNATKDIDQLARQQELLAEENAALEQRELDETIRRQRLQDVQVRGTALARASASGRRVEGSLQDYLTFIGTEQQRELDWTTSSGASRIQINLQTARNEARALRIQAKAKRRDAFSGLMTSFGYLDKSRIFG